ncbi:hypothetical protein F2P81_020938 [Scophthalmus maximus]|uniref:Uncharacterized protein n=1 Tax=Scophthalmus maximus TaxID=52904 RepID=A0A6A4S4Y9_SCOMX|nr:hypothetical protein F2P81_020938 [Scophthalmus maximus]
MKLINDPQFMSSYVEQWDLKGMMRSQLRCRASGTSEPAKSTVTATNGGDLRLIHLTSSAGQRHGRDGDKEPGVCAALTMSDSGSVATLAYLQRRHGAI